MGKRLQRGARSQESPVATLEQRRGEGPLEREPERAKKGYRAPHGRERVGAADDPSVLRRMEAGEQFAPVDRAGCRLDLFQIDEADRAATIEPTHQRDLPTTQGARTIEPDRQLRHEQDMVRPIHEVACGSLRQIAPPPSGRPRAMELTTDVIERGGGDRPVVDPSPLPSWRRTGSLRGRLCGKRSFRDRPFEKGRVPDRRHAEADVILRPADPERGGG